MPPPDLAATPQIRSRKPVVAIIAPVRQEAASLIEWIAYHRAQGISVFILADNGGDDGTSELLVNLNRCGVIIRQNWLGAKSFQLRFYQSAWAVARHWVDGAFIIDADEYLRPTVSGATAGQLATRWLADTRIGAVAINWAIYGSSGRTEPGDGLVIERFTRRATRTFAVNRHVKTFVRASNWVGLVGNPHAVKVSPGRYVTTAMEDVRWDMREHAFGITKGVVWKDLRIDHFVTKSRVEFEQKRRRGDALPYSGESEQERRWETYFNRHDHNDVSDPMPQALVEKTKAEMARLQAALAAT